MANDIKIEYADNVEKRYQYIKKTDEQGNIVLVKQLIGSSADIVEYNDSDNKLNAKTVQEAIEALKGLIGTGGVTGIKIVTDDNANPDASTGEVTITLTKEALGLDKVKNEEQVTVSQLGQATYKKDDGTVVTGVATLNENGMVPSGQLPSFVSEIINGYYNESNGKFYSQYNEETGEYNDAYLMTPVEDVIYLDIPTKNTYRWSDPYFVQISNSLITGTTKGTAYDGAAGQANADNIAAILAGTSGVGRVNNKLTLGLADEDGAEKTDTYDGSDVKSIGTSDNPVYKAHTAVTADTAGKLKEAKTISLSGDVAGSVSFDGEADADIEVTLGDSGVTAGTYCAVKVNSKGIVTSGGHIIEWGTETNAAPDEMLVDGGIFFELVEG